ncbi:MAG: cell envelope integrity protein CreD [Cryomorphaceae bacterium]
MSSENSRIEKVSKMIKGSVTLKLITITILMLLLLIPASMVKSIIQEREQLNNQVTREVSSKWANDQRLTGPILTIPLLYEYNKDEEESVTKVKYWHILPKNLNIDGEVIPEKLKRGLYEVVVYKSDIHLTGDYVIESKPDPNDLKEIQYDKAFLTMGISDLRGVKNQIKLNWGGAKLDVDPGSKLDDIVPSGITVRLPDLSEKIEEKLSFDFAVDLQGSKNLSFVPVGSTTNVDIDSPWSSPSFNGNFLPTTRNVTEDGFTASWSVLQLNRNYPQTWIGNGNSVQMDESSFGVDFILPLDDYQKSYRSAKYAALTISLTFLIFFLVEIMNGRRIHPFQYALVGLALCLFYVLLVSISEHTNFNFAYAVSALGIVLMISLYSISVFKKLKLSVLLLSVLSAIYGFLFVTLQLADYALVMGSVGLSLILALTMYFTRNINWYQLSIESDS